MATEVFPDLFVGGGDDFELVTSAPDWESSWFVISAAKEPWHRRAVGYEGRGAPKDSPEYLIAERPKDGPTSHLILNLVDAADPAYIPAAIVDKALETLDRVLLEPNTRKVLLHCNQGLSRSPTLALLWLGSVDARFVDLDFDDAVKLFKTLYPSFDPAGGMAGYAREHWQGGGNAESNGSSADEAEASPGAGEPGG